MWKSHEIQISASIKSMKVLTLIHSELSHCDRDRTAHRLSYICYLALRTKISNQFQNNTSSSISWRNVHNHILSFQEISLNILTLLFLQKDSMCIPIYLCLSKNMVFNLFPIKPVFEGGSWKTNMDGNTSTFQTKGKNFTSVNTLQISQALAKSALKILHLHLLLTSNIHKGHANTKHFQELMFPLESISFIWKGENKRKHDLNSQLKFWTKYKNNNKEQTWFKTTILLNCKIIKLSQKKNENI